MANDIKVLMQINSCFPDYDGVQEALDVLGKKELCRIIFECVSDDLSDEFPGEFPGAYFLDSYSIQFGAQDPVAFGKTLENWNEDVFSLFKSSLSVVEAIQKGWKKPDLLSTIRRLTELKDTLGFPYDTALYNLRKSLAALDNHIEYGCSHIVICDGENYGNEYSVMLPAKMIVNAKKNPENYAVFWLFYD